MLTLRTLGFGLIACLLACSPPSDDEAVPAATAPATAGALPSRPNILWLVAEDISPLIAAFGDSTIATPNLSRLAARGIRYPNAFVTAPVCAVSRTTLATGLYAVSYGAQHMRNQYATPDMAQLGLPAYFAIPPPEVRMLSQILRESGYFCTNNDKTDYQFQAPQTAWDEQSPRGHWRHRAPGQPFFSVFNFEITHESQLWTTGAKNFRYRPGFERDTAREIPWSEPYTADGAPMPLRVSPYLAVPTRPYLANGPLTLEDSRRLYSNIAVLDEQIGFMLDELEADGLTDSTVIFFYSDHGGPLPREKRLLYDSGLRIPLIVAYPDGRGAGTIDSALVSTLDFPPSTLSLAGVEVPAYMQGGVRFGESPDPQPEYVFATADRFDTEYDRIRAVRDRRYKYLRNYFPGRGYYLPIAYREQMGAMQELLALREAGELSGAQQQWFRDRKPTEELFDTATDPYELNNLADDPAYAERLATMRAALDDWTARVGDLGGLPERALIDSLWQGADSLPRTAPIVVDEGAEGAMALSDPTAGAQIAYRRLPADRARMGWRIYTEPIALQPGDTLVAQAQRIGFAASETTQVVGSGS